MLRRVLVAIVMLIASLAVIQPGTASAHMAGQPYNTGNAVCATVNVHVNAEVKFRVYGPWTNPYFVGSWRLAPGTWTICAHNRVGTYPNAYTWEVFIPNVGVLETPGGAPARNYEVYRR